MSIKKYVLVISMFGTAMAMQKATTSEKDQVDQEILLAGSKNDYMLGKMLLRGEGSAQDALLAQKYLVRAAQGNDPDAAAWSKFLLAQIYYFGMGCNKDTEKAFEYCSLLEDSKQTTDDTNNQLTLVKGDFDPHHSTESLKKITDLISFLRDPEKIYERVACYQEGRRRYHYQENLRTYLYKYASQGDCEAVQLLINLGATVDGVSGETDKMTPLHIASYKGHKECVKMLMKAGASLEKTDKDGNTALHLACKGGHNDVAAFLYDQGADSVVKNTREYTPLHYAVQHCSYKLVELFAQAGLPESIFSECKKGRYGISLIKAACKGSDAAKVAALLLKKSTTLRHNHSLMQEALVEAIHQGNLALVQLLVDYGASVTHEDDDLFTPLHEAVEEESIESVEIVDFLLKKGADINAARKDYQDKSRVTPLWDAVRHGKSALATFLVKKKADLSFADDDGNTLLHQAAENLDVPLVSLLLDSGLAHNVCNNNLHTPLHAALNVNTNRYNVTYYGKYNQRRHILDQDKTKQVEKNADEVIHRLMAQEIDVNKVDKQGMTLLHHAAKNRKGTVIKELIEKGAEIATLDNSGHSPLWYWLSKKYEEVSQADLTIEELLHTPNDHLICLEDGTTLLHIAAMRGNLEEVKRLLLCGADINATGKNERTPLYYAIEKSHEAVAACLLNEATLEKSALKSVLCEAIAQGNSVLTQLIIDTGLPINESLNEWNETALHKACQEGKLDVVELLLKLNADVHAVTNEARNKRTPLHYAADISCVWDDRPAEKIVALLCEHGALVNAKDDKGRTPLHLADRSGVVELLCSYEAQVDALDNDGNTPLHAFCNTTIVRDFYEVIKAFVAQGAQVASVNKVGESIVSAYVKRFFVKERCNRTVEYSKQAVEVLKLLVHHGADMNTPDNHGQLPLHMLADIHNIHELEVEGFVELTDDINTKNSLGYSALQLATKSPTLAAVLIQRGADCSVREMKTNQTLLHLFSGPYARSSDALLISLLEHIDIEEVDNEGNTPLHIACLYCSEGAIRQLVLHGASVNKKNNRGITPLHYLVKPDTNRSLLSFLLDKGAVLDAVDSEGNTPLHLLITRSVITILPTVEFLIRQGASLTATNAQGDTLLHTAVRANHDRVTAFLIERGCSVNAANNKGETPLHCIIDIKAGAHWKREMANLLIDQGADPNIQDADGNTVLHKAIQAIPKDTELLSYLVTCVDLTITNHQGRTPLHIAALLGHEHLVKLLLDNKADASVKDKNCKYPHDLAKENNHESTYNLLSKAHNL